MTVVAVAVTDGLMATAVGVATALADHMAAAVQAVDMASVAQVMATAAKVAALAKVMAGAAKVVVMDAATLGTGREQRRSRNSLRRSGP